MPDLCSRKKRTIGVRWPRLVIWLVVGVLALPLAACGEGGGGADQVTELRIGIPTGIANVDPAKDVNGRHHFFRYLAYEPIIYRDPATGGFRPALAEKYGYVGEGNTTYEFTLRKGATFADGSPVDAAAVKAWLDYFAQAGGGFTALLPLKSVTTDGDRTVRLELAKPIPIVEFYLSASNWGYVSQVDPVRMDKEMLGAGPYVYDPTASVDGDSYVFTARKDYDNPSVQHYEKVTVKVIDSPNAMLSALRSGQIDVGLGDTSTIKAADAAEGVDVFYGADGWAGFDLYDLAGKISPLGDVRVRQALNYAIDRETITSALVGKYGEPTTAWHPFEEVDPEVAHSYDYDPERAKELLAEAGHADGFTLPILVQGWTGAAGTPLAQAIASDLEKIGVRLDITTSQSSGDFYSKVLSGKWPAAQLFQLGSPIYSWATNRWVTDGSLDMFGYDHSESERLLGAASEASQNAAEPLWDAYNRFVTEQAFMLPVFTTQTIVYTDADRIAGVSMDNVGRYLAHSPFVLDIEPR